MRKRKQLSASERAKELAKIELRPDAEKRSDDLLRALLATPPDPFTHKLKKKRRKHAE
jgi:hypothetical protein